MNAAFPDDQNEAAYLVRQFLHVAQDYVEEAKRIILDVVRVQTDSASLINAVLARKGISAPAVVAIDKSINSIVGIRSVAAVYSWRLASAEAILRLVHSDDLVAMDERLYIPHSTIRCVVGPAEGAPTLVEKKLVEFDIPVPALVRLAPSREYRTDRRPA
jgi:hypothetical protein